ncbi:hypothetical protein D3C78_1678910 [compost metagenome]
MLQAARSATDRAASADGSASGRRRSVCGSGHTTALPSPAKAYTSSGRGLRCRRNSMRGNTAGKAVAMSPSSGSNTRSLQPRSSKQASPTRPGSASRKAPRPTLIWPRQWLQAAIK